MRGGNPSATVRLVTYQVIAVVFLLAAKNRECKIGSESLVGVEGEQISRLWL